MAASLDAWIEEQHDASALGLMRAVSCGLTKTRPGFSQRITARAGSVVASPVLAAYDPDPDYFFHWFRDAAIVIDAMRLLRRDQRMADYAQHAFADFVTFSLSLQNLDGASLLRASGWRAGVAPGFQQYLRSDADLASVRGTQVVTDTRVNPDGTLDISRWARPQYDGAALRALTLLRWLSGDAEIAGAAQQAAAQLLMLDLRSTAAHCRKACFDIWEEDLGFHYYTLRVGAAALGQGARWLDARGEQTLATEHERVAYEILRGLDDYWLETSGYYRSRVLKSGAQTSKELDFAVILAVLHADAQGARHSVFDARMQSTFEQLVQLFDAEYPINRSRHAGHAPAMGRYAGDRYYSGGPYFFSTLGAAEFCYRIASGGGQAETWMRRGDSFLETVRRFTPPDRDFAEQFDRDTGLPRSARDLAWSHAAFLSCANARRLT